MNKKILSSGIMTLVLLMTSCVGNVGTIAPPAFITATLPSTNTPLPTASTSTSPVSTMEIVPTQLIEAVTTTQLNLRSEPSTAGESLGIVAAFSTVQIIAKESNGKWIQILDSASADGKGWIIASYVQVNDPGQIPVINLGPTGLIIQGLNVRSGPGKETDSLGTLVANDVVLLTGRDSSSSWLQINFKGSLGWIASEFVQVQNIEILPISAGQNKETANPEPSASSVIPPSTMQDNDSLDIPSASVNLSFTGTGRLQSNGFVSLSNGDEADWIQFTVPDAMISIQIKCSENDLKSDLYQNGMMKNEGFLTCNEIKTLNTTSGLIYTLKLIANAETKSITPYSVFVNIVR